MKIKIESCDFEDSIKLSAACGSDPAGCCTSAEN